MKNKKKEKTKIEDIKKNIFEKDNFNFHLGLPTELFQHHSTGNELDVYFNILFYLFPAFFFRSTFSDLFFYSILRSG